MAHSTAADALKAEYEEAARGLAARLSGLPEAPMRAAALAETLTDMGPVGSVWTIETIIRGALCKEAAFVAAYDSLVDPRPLFAALGDQRLDAMLQAGREEGCVAAIQWLLSGNVKGREDSRDVDRLVDRELRELTLGGRRALARRARGEMVNRLAVDPDPGVISNLLCNPHVTEQIVLNICSRRPTVSAALEAVLASRRWMRRHAVRVALVKNPYLAGHVATNLLVYLGRVELRAVRDDETLDSGLRLAAQRLLDLPRD